MRHPLRQFSASVSRSLGSWLTLVLLFAVLVPSLGLLWLMNRAVENERLALRQKLVDTYRAQLAAARDQIAARGAPPADRLAAMLDDRSPAAVFAAALREDRADAVVCLHANGALRYPDPPASPRLPATDPAWVAAERLEAANPAAAAPAYAALAQAATVPDEMARALRAQARVLVRAGDTRGALEIANGPLQRDGLRAARDPQTHLIVLQADLLALELARALEPGLVEPIRARLLARALDYDHLAIPATQRRFVLRELGAAEPSHPAAAWYAAEALAASYAQLRERPAPATHVQPAGLPDVWQQASSDGRLVLLHRTARLSARVNAAVRPPGLSPDVRFEVLPPAAAFEHALLWVPAGPMLPDWKLALHVDDATWLDAADQRITSYAWMVALVVIAASVLALLAGGLIRRQIALTRLRNELVANVTHELKTPLASMRLLVDTLLNAPRLEEQTTREYLQLIASENLRLSRLIGNFLTFSRIERNRYSFDFADTPVGAIVDAAAAAVRDRMQAPGCTFAVEVAPGLPRLRADAGALVTALVNLLDNAWKYSGDAKEIALTAAARDGHVVLAVRDNGIGLDPRDTARIFRRFEQVRPTQPTGGGGAGLGLSIVEFIVRAHRGTVAVASEPGRGSTFTITLPAISAAEAPPP